MRRKNPDYVSPELEALKNAPQLPEAAAYLWRWFAELSATRQAVPYSKPLPDGRILSGFQALALPPSEIAAWCDRSGIRLAPWEFRLLLALDRAYMAARV